jgi:hypothetical protein
MVNWRVPVFHASAAPVISIRGNEVFYSILMRAQVHSNKRINASHFYPKQHGPDRAMFALIKF